MKLPAPQDEFFRQAFRTLEAEDSKNHKKDRDIELGMTSIIMTAPNGTRYKLIVSNTGVLSTMAV